MEILTNNNNPVTLKLIISSIFTKMDVNIKIITENDAKTKKLKELPTFTSETGLKLSSSNAASKYLCPPNENIINSVNQLLEWEFGTFTPVLLNNMATKSEPSNKSELLKCFIKLETLLAKQSFLSGNVISVADISIFSMLYPLFSTENEYGNNYPKLNKWFTNFKNLPEVQDALKRYPVSHGKAAYLVILESIPESFQNIYMQSVKVITEESKATGSPSHQAIDAVTPSELLKAEESWKNISSIAKPKSRAVPVVPVEGERNILITSALPYVNNVPHLGNIIGCVLSADVFARYCRLCNYNTLYICGTDEYGTATETKALAENTTPQQICDKYFQIHNDIYRWFGIGFDYFGRTTTAEQTEICQEMFLKILSNGFIITQSVEQLFCPKCERFLADRFVEGGCPQLGCGYEDARGDQCDGCGKLVNATELKNPRCKLCSTTPKIQSSEQFFLDLPKIEPILKLWMQDSCSGWSNNARVIGQSWIKEGLKPRCITRDLKWGIPVPLEQYNKKVFYVWFDAPIGYMSITKRYAPKDWLKWWKPETKSMSIELHQFMAKDNVPFHAVMFPATLLAANEGHTKVTNLWATEYLNYEDGKFSKSRGVGVFGNDARDTGISADVWRFYLTYVRPESQDSSFSWVDLATKNNSELLNNLGNFVNRALVFAEKNFNSIIQDMTPNVEDYTLFALCSRELTGYVTALDKARLRDGIRHILSISRHGNQYMQANQPWVLCKGNPEERARAGTVIGISCNLACLLAILIHPYMPETSRVMKQQLNAPDSIFVLNPSDPVVSNLLPAGHKLGKPSPLFSKIEDAKVEELKAKYAGVQQTEEKKVSAKPKQTENQKNNQKLVGDPAELSRIEQEITKQGEVVRTLKTSGAEKSVWQPEVNKLLELKAKLVAMGGAVAPPPTSKSKKNRK